MRLPDWMIAICLMVVSNGCRESTEKAETAPPPDRNRIDLARAVLQVEGVEHSEEELIAFDRSARITEAIIAAGEAPPLIEILRPNQPPTNVPFQQIDDHIRAGNVVRAIQNHSNHVEILTRDGQRVTSTQPKIDTILELIQEVDPESLFIELWTE